MKTLPLLVLSTVTAAAVAAGTAGLAGGRVAAEQDSAGGDAALERLTATVAELSRSQQGLAEDLRRLREEDQLHPVAAGRSEVPDVDAAVARWMAEHGSAAGAAPLAADESAAATDDSLEQALALLDGDLSDTERQRLWRKFAEQGLTDAIVAAWEERAARAPNDPDMQVSLGEIYLNKIFEVGNSPEAGVWATKADRAFDKALAIDDHHWEARFAKAVSLSFWPPVFGKQGEAIQHFETLVAQQAAAPREDRYAQTHLLLGNMYSQTGEEAKAIAAWQRGLEIFPENEELQKQLAIHGVK